MADQNQNPGGGQNPKDAKQMRAELAASEIAARDLARNLGYVLENLKESASILNKQAAVYSSLTKSSQLLNYIAKDSVQVAKDVTALYDKEVQISNDLLLKRNMLSTGLKGDYAQLVTTYMLENDISDVNDKKVQLLVKQLKHREHLTEEMSKEVEIAESLANWQLQLTEELEEYGKGWEKLKSKVRAVISDPQMFKTFLTVKGIETIKEKLEEGAEVFSEFRKEGLTMTQALGKTTSAIGAAFSFTGVGMKDAAEIQGAMLKEMGSMKDITRDTVVETGMLAKTFGVSNEAAGKLVSQLQQMPGATKETSMETFEYAGALAKAANVAPGAVMESIANNAEATAMYAKDGGKNIATAAVAAKKLGLEFGTITKMADNLLDFENSLNKQLEASVLLGREINLDKARELALNGDLVGATKEMLANVGGEAEFNKMNHLQRKALADAMGVSVQELSKMVKHQDELANLTEEQQEALANGASMTDVLAANASGFAGKMYDGLLAAGGLIGSVGTITSGLKGAVSTGKDFVNGFKEGSGFLNSMKEGLKSMVGLGKSVTDKLSGATPQLQTKGTDLVSGAADKTKMASDSTKGASAGQGMGVKGFLKGLAEGFKEFANAKTIAGMAVIALSFPAFAYSFKLVGDVMKDVDPMTLLTFGVALGGFALELALIGKFTNQIIQGSLAAVIMGGALAVAAYGLSLVSEVNPDILLPFGLALGALGLGVALLGMMAGQIVAGSIALGILGLALLPATLAFQLLSGVDTDAMITFSIVLPLLGLAAAGLGLISPLIAAGALAMGILGVSMLPVAAGLLALQEAQTGIVVLQSLIQTMNEAGPGIALGAVGFGILAFSLTALGTAALYATPGLLMLSLLLPPIGAAIKDIGEGVKTATDGLVQLITNAAGLDVVVSGLQRMAAELENVASAGTTALPVLESLNSLAGGTAGGGEGGQAAGNTQQEDKMDILIGKIDQIIAMASKPGIVNIDGRKLTEFIRLGVNATNIG